MELVDKTPPSRSSLSMHSPHSGAMLLSPFSNCVVFLVRGFLRKTASI
uniref:Uncharacterized protein n=1 Tax=Brassica oleracea TaxID=3712 RepID=A0A3P6FH65_BRAOL|nr:unnamed protein product [Brassica oleracea]